MLVVSKMSVLTVYIEKNMVDSFIAFVCYNDKKKLCIFASTDVTMGINIFAMTTMNKKIAHLKYLNRFKKKKKNNMNSWKWRLFTTISQRAIFRWKLGHCHLTRVKDKFKV